MNKSIKYLAVLLIILMPIAAYAEMWEERMTDMPIQQLVLMVTPEDGNAQIFTEDRETYKNSRIGTLKNIIQEFNNNSTPK